ncbi:MAG: TPR repeat protein [Parcubacteria group bacterium Athens0416_74]|nr:MAG: TPR repeat protein [Parcubacteria group bacterium Athens0416_74]
MTALEKTLRWIALGGIFALPFVGLLVTSSLFFPYITGKNFAFRIIVEVITAAWLALAIVNPSYRPRRSWLLGALALFVLIIGIADVFGAYAFKSLWSNYERMDGWVTIAHLLAYTIVASAMLQSEKLWRWLLWTTLGVSAYLSLYGLLQVTGKVALGLGGVTGLSGRIDGTFGNPIYFAVYMLFHVFIAAMLWAQQWVEKGPGKRLYISAAYASIIALDTMALFLTGTRGTMLGIIGGTLLSALLMLIFARKSRNVWRASAAVVFGIFALTGVFFMVKDQAWVQKVGFLNRLASISLSDQTTESRFVNWSMAWEGVKENYALVFDKYYDPRMYKQEPWFDRVHNIVFDWLVAGGFLGLITYLSIFIVALWTLWRSGGFTIAERSLLTGLLAGYFCHNFFVFDNVTSYILFGTILAFIAYRSSKASDAPAILASRSLSQNALPYAAVLCAIALLFVAWSVNQKPLAANRLMLNALNPQSDALTKLDHLRQSIELGTYGMQEAREQLSQMAATASGSSGVSEDVRKAYFELAITEMEKQAEMSPLDARFPLFLGVVYSAFGQYDNARIAYEKALELSPKKQSIMYLLGENASVRGDSAAALSYYKRAYELETSNREAAMQYAAALIRADQAAAAEALLAPYIESGNAADPRILSAYRAKNQMLRAIPIWEASIRANPEDAQGYFTLAAIHYLSGNSAKAIAVLEDAKRRLPGIAVQADPVIEQIRAGTAVVQ